ncbi:hypothetical protein BOTBODRAFT_502158 [Botryobasidium botryosum FD-172 SS1]|uniref:Uncharacterized protein n=1 Tax=Botryobasidium botryosum (strain FD-172 SS1) TaxID=930990 RepID=A0A067M2X4_BOTB1|nr:hypothetical protein BOTBODRAFT_502158 [Botryobasidium botryosum FD-172 SS1]
MQCSSGGERQFSRRQKGVNICPPMWGARKRIPPLCLARRSPVCSRRRHCCRRHRCHLAVSVVRSTDRLDFQRWPQLARKLWAGDRMTTDSQYLRPTLLVFSTPAAAKEVVIRALPTQTLSDCRPRCRGTPSHGHVPPLSRSHADGRPQRGIGPSGRRAITA